jgi:hypothetical protein
VIIAWILVKAVHVHAVLPHRNAGREPKAKGQELAALVPPGETLYVLGLRDKDEGILFYYGRPTRRLTDSQTLPPHPVYCLLEDYELQHWDSVRGPEPIHRLLDETGNPLILVRVP